MVKKWAPGLKTNLEARLELESQCQLQTFSYTWSGIGAQTTGANCAYSKLRHWRCPSSQHERFLWIDVGCPFSLGSRGFGASACWLVAGAPNALAVDRALLFESVSEIATGLSARLPQSWSRTAHTARSRQQKFRTVRSCDVAELWKANSEIVAAMQ